MGDVIPLKSALRDKENGKDKENGVFHAVHEVHEVLEVKEEPELILDRGGVAWRTLLGSFICQFCTLGTLSAFGVYEDFYTRQYLTNKAPSDISWIGSFQMFVQYALSIFVGRAFDHGYFHYILAFGSFLEVFCMFMLSLAKSGQFYQVFLAQGLGLGIGHSMLFLPSLAIIGHHFKDRRTLATGLVVTGASFGGIVWPIMLNQLLRRTSFGTSVRGLAGLLGFLLLSANLLMRTQPHHKSPDRYPTNSNSWIKVLMTDWAYVTNIVAACLIAFGLFFPNFYLQLYAIDKGVDQNLAFYVVAILNAGTILGRIIPNIFAQRLGIYNMIIPSTGIASILLFVIFALKSFASIVVFAVIYGFVSGAYFSLIPALIGQLSRHVSELGTRMGVAFTCVGFCWLVGLPIEGALLNHTGTSYTWWRSIVFCGVVLAAGTVTNVISRTLFLRDGRRPERGQRI